MISVGLVCTVIDFILGVSKSIATNSFSMALVPQFLQTHILNRVLPITALIALSLTFPIENAAHTFLWTTALVGLGGYIAETVKSAIGNATEMYSAT